MNSLSWICFLSLLFWGIYQKWDEKRMSYTQNPIRTSLYFFFSSLALILVYPKITKLFQPTLFSILFFITIISLTFLLYKILKILFRGPKTETYSDHAYWKMLDQKYIPPKIFEIGFQQTFLGAIFIVVTEKYGLNIETILFFILSFILAHVPLIFLQGKKIGLTYLKWSILGAPIFVFLIVTTNSLWYSISIHMFFYTMLSFVTWIFTGTKYSEDK
jgi:hypothetical protein